MRGGFRQSEMRLTRGGPADYRAVSTALLAAARRAGCSDQYPPGRFDHATLARRRRNRGETPARGQQLLSAAARGVGSGSASSSDIDRAGLNGLGPSVKIVGRNVRCRTFISRMAAFSLGESEAFGWETVCSASFAFNLREYVGQFAARSIVNVRAHR